MGINDRFDQIVNDINNRPIMPEKAPSLEPMREALRRMNFRHPQTTRSVILVAGTNGKGTVAKTLQTLLNSCEQKTGLYTSPHLYDITERIRVDGAPIGKQQFCDAYEKVMSALDGYYLTHFEILTAMAVEVFFHQEKVDKAIFEVGLGGLWDATNAIPHDVCAIARIGYDHQHLLGNSLSEIAANKFGIVNAGSLVVHLPFCEEVRSLAGQIQKDFTKSRWLQSEDFKYRVEVGPKPKFFIQTQWGEAELSLPGLRAAENSSLALSVLAELGFDPSKHLSALKHVDWPARMQRIQTALGSHPVYLSADHNEQGIDSLLELLEYYSRDKLHILFGVGKTKNFHTMLEKLMTIPESELYLTQSPFRGLSVEEFGDWTRRAKGAWEDPKNALSNILSKVGADDMVLVTGSIYLLGEFAPQSSC